MQCVEIMSLAHKHKNDVYFTSNHSQQLCQACSNFLSKERLFPGHPGTSKVFYLSPSSPSRPSLIVNFDGQRLSPSLEQSLNCVYLCVCTCVYCVYLCAVCVLVNTLLSRAISQLEEKLISSSGNSILPDCLSSRRLQSL